MPCDRIHATAERRYPPWLQVGSPLFWAARAVRDIADNGGITRKAIGLAIGLLAAWVPIIGYLPKQSWNEARDWAEGFGLDPCLRRQRAKA